DYSARAIEKELKNRGYLGRNGTPIAHNTITGIIQNPKYKGYYCGNKVRITDYRTKKQRFLPEEEWVMYKDETGETVPAIVSEDLWNRCNSIFNKRSSIVKSHRTSIKNSSVFTGKIWCGAHDKPFWRTNYSNSKTKGRTIHQWICSEKRKNGARACATVSIMENELYSVLSDYFIDIAENIDEYVTDFLRLYDETERADDQAKQIDMLKAKLSKENTKRDKLLELYVDGTITKSEFSERNAKIGIEISNLEEDIIELQKRNISEKEYRRELKEIENYFRTMYDPATQMTKEQVDAMTEAIVERITVIPVNKNNMKLEIALKTGANGNIPYSTSGRHTACRSGNTFKKMIESYENKQ
ncbi:MAG: recombinase family protein, partial [Oscillospiraceae bacterium]|nr:recombinase family protein [Oscillospiraceae bacterium]